MFTSSRAVVDTRGPEKHTSAALVIRGPVGTLFWWAGKISKATNSSSVDPFSLSALPPFLPLPNTHKKPFPRIVLSCPLSARFCVSLTWLGFSCFFPPFFFFFSFYLCLFLFVCENKVGISRWPGYISLVYPLIVNFFSGYL